MFVGHLAAALGAKRLEPRLSLGVLVAAAFGLDLLWPAFLLLGVEHVRVDPGNTAFTPLAFDSYPWSHSLAAALLWGAVAAVAIGGLDGLRPRILIAAAVVSHWVLDFITHRPDLPLWPGGPQVGLGLWNSIPGTILVEGTLFIIAIEAYRRAFKARDRVGRWSFWGFDRPDQRDMDQRSVVAAPAERIGDCRRRPRDVVVSTLGALDRAPPLAGC